MKATNSRSVVSALLALLLAAALTPLATGQARSGSAAQPQKQAIDEAYTAKIREYTTDKHFLTEMVDHLPASATVPTPEKVLGYVIGTPNKLTYTKDVNRYFRELAKATQRVKVWVAGKSEEGREMLLVAISDDANMAKLDRYKEITAKLADPRKISDAEAEALIAEGKPIYWLSGAIHSPETGSPEMLMELAYRLAVSESPFIRNIRGKAIVLITPVLEVDGRDRRVDTYNYQKANPGKPAPGLVYWGKYVAHDNNRDSIAMALELSKAQMRNFLEWHPQVLHDLHESVPFLYVSTGTGPYNAWLDPIVVSEWQKLAYYEVEEMTKRGVPGVWTHGFYDGWAPNYMFYVANGHNSIGRFYETYGGTGADTRMRRVGPNQTSRTWFRPNPPLPRVKWSIRNNVNLQQSGVLLAITYTANNGAEFLRNFYLKGKRSVAKATTEGPAAWIIRNDKRPQLAGQLANLMQRQGAEVQRLDADFELKAEPSAAATESAGRGRVPRASGEEASGEEASGEEAQSQEQPQDRRRAAPQPTKIPKGSYVVRMDQPYSRMVDMLLDTQFYSTRDPRPYDDTGWTLGPLRNVETNRVADTAILKAPMTLVSDQIRASGKITGASATTYYVVNATAEPALATLRFRLKEMKFFAAQEAFEADGKKFDAGSFLISTEGNPADLRSRLASAAAELGIDAHATDADIKTKRHEMKLPRIALMHTWVNTQNEGWFRLALEETGVPYAYISDQDVRSDADLKAKYDVIIFPPVTSNISTLINGVRKRMLDDGSDFNGPIPWKDSELTPNLAGNDETDDIRGGLGFAGLANLKKFIEDGGVFIPVTASTALPIELGMTEGVSITETRQLAARGAIVNATVDDKASPIAYGYDDKLSVYFSQSPVFRVSVPGVGFGGGAGGGRTAGRGSSSDPDIPQGRPWEHPEREPRRSRAEQETYVDPD
ncbi:MAG: M14 family zinc carboxypeptidase, partial [Candidatus Acidiferrales bacterium]